MPKLDLDKYFWNNAQSLLNRYFTCGFCGVNVSSTIGLGMHLHNGGTAHGFGVYICPNCKGPNFFSPSGLHSPSPSLGKSVEHVPDGLSALYEEARRSTSQNCYTGAVLLCRKMLMNIAVELGAQEGLPFIEYVKYLSDNGYVPPNGKHWVDHVRRKGNEAAHEISLMTANDARELLTFVEMLLRFIYEFPSMIPVSP